MVEIGVQEMMKTGDFQSITVIDRGNVVRAAGDPARVGPAVRAARRRVDRLAGRRRRGLALHGPGRTGAGLRDAHHLPGQAGGPRGARARRAAAGARGAAVARADGRAGARHGAGGGGGDVLRCRLVRTARQARDRRDGRDRARATSSTASPSRARTSSACCMPRSTRWRRRCRMAARVPAPCRRRRARRHRTARTAAPEPAHDGAPPRSHPTLARLALGVVVGLLVACGSPPAGRAQGGSALRRGPRRAPCVARSSPAATGSSSTSPRPASRCVRSPRTSSGTRSATGRSPISTTSGGAEPGQPLVVPLKSLNPIGVYADEYQTVPILAYHRFGTGGGKMVVSPSSFAAQLEWLARNDYRVIPLGQLAGYLAGRQRCPSGPWSSPSTTATNRCIATRCRCCAATAFPRRCSSTPISWAPAMR